MKNSANARISARNLLIILAQKKLLTLAFGRRTFPPSQSQHLVFAFEGKPKVWVWLVEGAGRSNRSDLNVGDGDNRQINDIQRTLSGTTG